MSPRTLLGMKVVFVALAVLLSTGRAARTHLDALSDAVDAVAKGEDPPVSQGHEDYCSTAPVLDKIGWPDGRRQVIFYGGTFDPPTRAHINNGRIALDVVGAPCVWFSPLYHPDYKPLKTNIKTRGTLLSESFSADKRMQLSKAYEKSYKAFEDDGQHLEVQRMDFEAYKWLVRTYPNTDFDMIVGADNFHPTDSPYTEEGWKEIMGMVSEKGRKIAVIPRGDDIRVSANARAYQEHLKEKHGIHSDLFANLDVDNSQFKFVSSSGIRRLFAKANNGVIDEPLAKELLDAGFSEDLVHYMSKHTKLVLEYAADLHRG